MTILLIGAGQAAIQTISSLRQGGYDGAITLLGDENHLPYQRPPLSKKYLTGELEAARLYLKPDHFFEEHNITVKLATRATAIDPVAQSVSTDGDESIAYDKLVLTTGSRPRQLPITGIDLGNIFDLRGIDDIDAIRGAMAPGKRLVIIGGGYIGLETAASARTLGLDVTVVEAAPRVLARVTHADMSAFFTRVHAEEGVRILTDAQLDHISGVDGRVEQVHLANGAALPADLVIMGVGIVPNIELAAAAGIDIDTAHGGGIAVDANGRTSEANIYAAGDCTSHPNDLLGYRLRLESVPNAIEQGKAVAADIMGRQEPYNEIPWFWSDQYDVKLQIAGLSGAASRTVARGDTQTRSFATFYFAEDKLIAVEAVNRPAEFMAARKLIGAAATGFAVDAAALSDEDSKPKDWLAAL